MAASNKNRKEEQYEQVGVGAVPDFYEPDDDDEDDSKLAPLEKSKMKAKKEEKEEDFS